MVSDFRRPTREVISNYLFGGHKRNRLFMCGSTSIYSLYVNTQGAAGG